MLAQFRHQYFVFLIAHLHGEHCFVFADLLVDAVNDLDIPRRPFGPPVPSRRIRANFEPSCASPTATGSTRFPAAPCQAIFRLCARPSAQRRPLRRGAGRNPQKCPSIWTAIPQRRQSNTVVRLTVITILGLIATVTTGYFGMNIIPFGKGSIERVMRGLVATVVFVCLVLFAVARSKRLSTFSKTSPTSVSDSLPNWPPWAASLTGRPQLLTICKPGVSPQFLPPPLLIGRRRQLGTSAIARELPETVRLLYCSAR